MCFDVGDSMPAILSTNGRQILVDQEDFNRLNKFRWYVSPDGYAERYTSSGTRRLHREVFEASCHPGRKHGHIDHKNHNKLDNRKENLRFCTNSQNHANAPKQKREDATSKYKGVGRKRNKWRARIEVEGRQKSLGSFAREDVAALAYDMAATRYFGEFACLNFN